MAIMCPSVPREHTEASREGEIFDVLSRLPDTYYVFHSVTVVNIDEYGLVQHEGDFVIFNREKGILCIEAKAGQMRYENGFWYRGQRPMDKSPFKQSDDFKRTLMDKLKSLGYVNILRKCKFLSAVFFPSIVKKRFEGVYLPAEADKSLILYKDSEEDIEKAVSDIFDIPSGNKRTLLSDNDVRIILNNYLAPHFDLISISQIRHDNNIMMFERLLREQNALLNYLEEQDRAVINGMAGTGKTLMAVEKAKRHAMNNERVLFLCYNRFLADHLKASYSDNNIDFYTIDALACKLCNTKTSDLNALNEYLEECYLKGEFPYKHIIIDEGQDFGQVKIEENSIIDSLKMLVLDNDFNNGSFYIFYDKNQLVQGQKIPDYISDSDCKLTLYRNCRNTANIAKTSLRLLGNDKPPKLKENCIKGDSPEMFIESDKEALLSALNHCIDKNKEEGMESIVILTCSTEEKSIFAESIKDGFYKYNGVRYRFTTCRKFKGLEADAVIITDIDNDSFAEAGEKLTYVGSSRAKYLLSLIAQLSEEECCEILDMLGVRSGKNPRKSLVTSLNSKYVSLSRV